jgi:hypothetical protein
MKEIFIVSENEDIFTMFSNALSYLPVHFSWVGDMDHAEKQFRSEKPDLVFFAVRKLTLLHNWIARYKSFKMKIPFICFISKIGWEKRELLWMAGAIEVIELPKLEKEFKQIMESVLLQKDSAAGEDDLNGHLSVFNVVDLINTFQDGKKNGTIELKSKNWVGQLQFNKGTLVNAIYSNQEPLDAVLVMSSWSDGIFRAKLDNMRHNHKIQINNQEIIKACQEYLAKRGKLLASLPETDKEFYAAPLLDYEELSPQLRQHLLAFKSGRTISEFIDKDSEGSLKLLEEIKSWVKNEWLIDKATYKEQQLIIKEREQESGVMKMISKIFSKEREINPVKSVKEDKEEFNTFEDEMKSSQKKNHLFNDYEYLKQFSMILEENIS